DSLIGPLGPLDELLRRLQASVAQVWAATANYHPVEHLQSYLLAFRGGILAQVPLAQFFAAVLPLESKRAVVETYEMGLTQTIDRSGLSRAAGWTQAELGVGEATDLPLQQWKQLLEAGFPFVKRVLLTGPQFADQRAAVDQVVRGTPSR